MIAIKIFSIILFFPICKRKELKSFQLLENFKKIFPLAFFNILTEPLLVQKQTIHQQKTWDLSYLEPEEQGCDMVRRVPHPLAAKYIEEKGNLT